MTTNPFLIVAAAAAMTILTRAFPFLMFGRGEKPIPQAVVYLGKILPAAVIAILVVYCFRNLQPLAWPHGLPELLASAVVVVVHVWKRSNLLSIALGTGVYMVLVQVVF